MTRECITHHFACDCREQQFKDSQDKIKALEAKLAEAVDALKEIDNDIPDDAELRMHIIYLREIARECVKSIREGE